MFCCLLYYALIGWAVFRAKECAEWRTRFLLLIEVTHCILILFFVGSDSAHIFDSYFIFLMSSCRSVVMHVLVNLCLISVQFP